MWPFDSNNQQMYQRYAQAYNSGNYSNIDPNEAAAQLQAFLQNAPPDVQQRILQEHFNNMSPSARATLAQQMPPEYGVNPNDPSSMAQGFQRVGKERPELLQKVFAHPVLTAGAVGLTALIAKHMLEEHSQAPR